MSRGTKRKKGRDVILVASPRPGQYQPSAWTEALRLEGELRAEPKRRRSLYQHCRSVEWIEYRINSRRTAVNLEGLIQSHCTLTVEDVEPVSGQPQFALLTNFDWIVHAQIQVHRGRRPALADALDDVRESCLGSSHCRNDGRTALDREPFIVSIDRVRNQLVERRAGLHVEVSANEKLERSPIAAVELELVRAIVGQPAVLVLEQTDEVEQ